jgi:hypothetical protein
MRRPAPTFVYAPPRKPPRGREPKRTALLDVYEAQEKLHEIMDDSFKRKVQHDMGSLNRPALLNRPARLDDFVEVLSQAVQIVAEADARSGRSSFVSPHAVLDVFKILKRPAVYGTGYTLEIFEDDLSRLFNTEQRPRPTDEDGYSIVGSPSTLPKGTVRLYSTYDRSHYRIGYLQRVKRSATPPSPRAAPAAPTPRQADAPPRPRTRARSTERNVVTSSDIMGGLGAEVAAAVRRAMKGLG